MHNIKIYSKQMSHITGILYISSTIYENNSYKCLITNGIHKDKTVLISYKKKKDFNKSNKKYYILLDYDKSIFKLKETIGPVDDIISFYKYQLFKYNLFNNKITGIIQSENTIIENLTDTIIYTIDPSGCKDIDDAYSILEDDINIYLSIYISDPTEYLPFILKIIKGRYESIYLKEENLHMLPSKLSEGLLSLLENECRNVIKMAVIINKITKKKEIKFTKDKIKVFKNLTYGNPISNQLITTLNSYFNGEITDDHKAIEFLMKLFSIHAADYLHKNNVGIFRITENYYSVIYSINPIIHNQIGHLYVHITSPIRRFIDLINIVELNNIIEKNENRKLIEEYYSKIEEINICQKHIKKIQKYNYLLNILSAQSINKLTELNDVNSIIIEGQIINKINETYYVLFKLEEITFIQKYNTKSELILNNSYKFEIYLFNSEIELKKIKLKCLEF